MSYFEKCPNIAECSLFLKINTNNNHINSIVEFKICCLLSMFSKIGMPACKKLYTVFFLFFIIIILYDFDIVN